MIDDFDIDAVLEHAKQSAHRNSAINTADNLRARFIAINKRYALFPGMIVTWKPGLRNRGLPKDEAPAIVMSVLDVPVTDTTKNSGSPYFREPLDIIVGVLDPDGDLVQFYIDGRRLMPFYGEMEAEDAP